MRLARALASVDLDPVGRAGPAAVKAPDRLAMAGIADRHSVSSPRIANSLTTPNPPFWRPSASLVIERDPITKRVIDPSQPSCETLAPSPSASNVTASVLRLTPSRLACSLSLRRCVFGAATAIFRCRAPLARRSAAGSSARPPPSLRSNSLWRPDRWRRLPRPSRRWTCSRAGPGIRRDIRALLRRSKGAP